MHRTKSPSRCAPNAAPFSRDYRPATPHFQHRGVGQKCAHLLGRLLAIGEPIEAAEKPVPTARVESRLAISAATLPEECRSAGVRHSSTKCSSPIALRRHCSRHVAADARRHNFTHNHGCRRRTCHKHTRCCVFSWRKREEGGVFRESAKAFSTAVCEVCRLRNVQRKAGCCCRSGAGLHTCLILKAPTGQLKVARIDILRPT